MGHRSLDLDYPVSGTIRHRFPEIQNLKSVWFAALAECLSPTLRPMFEDYLYWLDQIRISHRRLVGDKAFYLALLAQRGYPVIPGVVVSASAFRAFLEQIEWTEPMFADLPNSSLHIDVDNSRQLRVVAQQLRQAIESAPVPDTWLDQLETAIQPWQLSSLILRPSIALPSGSDLTVSSKTVGLLEAHVCPIDRSALAHGLKQVWAELFRAKSLLYWQRLRIQLQQIHFAVLVQPIQSAIASGEAKIDEHNLEVRAVWGLGKALVSGEALPDSYQVNLHTGAKSHQPGNQAYTYEIGSTSQESSFPLAVSATEGYHVHPLNGDRPLQTVLNPHQLQQILHLAQQVAADLGTQLKLEWTLVNPARPTEETSSAVYLTQVIPDFRSRRWENGEPDLSVRSLPSAEPAPDTSSPAAFKGLAAAPGQTIAQAWVVDVHRLSTQNIPSGVILVASNVTPDWLPWLKQASGVITEQGGMTSHGAMLAREIGIPAVAGVANATQIIRTGERWFMDGDRGEVRRIDGMVEEAPVSHSSSALHMHASSPMLHAPSSPPPLATQLFVTLSQTDTIEQAASLPVDGVGLLRSELMLLEALEHHHPNWWLQQGRQIELIERVANQIQQFAQAFAPHPVFYRSSDLRSHEFAHLEGYPSVSEPNPMLGVRGIFSYQVNPGLFEIELAALKQVQQRGYTNVHLMLPFVRTVEEFVFCRQRIERVGLMQNPDFQLWIMAEVPSVLLLLPDYIKAGVQGIAIGSNDLTQLLLGVDRDQPQLAPAFNPRHPAVIRAIHQLIQTARHAQIPCSLCGHAPGQYPDLLDSLVRWGITAVSVEPNQVERVHQAIARAEHRLLLEAARQQLKIDSIDSLSVD